MENQGIGGSDTGTTKDTAEQLEAAVRSLVEGGVVIGGEIMSGQDTSVNIKAEVIEVVGLGGLESTGDDEGTEESSSVVVSAEETAAVGLTQVQMTGTGIEKVGGKIIEDSSVVPMVDQGNNDAGDVIIARNNIASVNEGGNKSNGGVTVVVTTGTEGTSVGAAQTSASVSTGDLTSGSDTEVMEIQQEAQAQPVTTAAATTTVTQPAMDTADESEDDGAWNRNNCIVCNTELQSIEQKDPNQVEGNKKLKKFFLEYLGVNESADPNLSDDTTFPFCVACADDLDKLMGLACKIEFMDLQFEKLRDTLARKTVKTYLCRTRPEMLSEEAEPIVDITDEPFDTNAPKPLLHPADVLFNQWKRQYEYIIPGRYKKFPTLMKTADSKQRVSYYRIDPSGKHHFIATVNPTEASDSQSDVSPASAGVKRKVATVLKINGETIGIKRIRTLSEGDDTDEDMEHAMELESADEDRQYKCSMCPKSFSSRSILNYHARVHSGDRPFKCNICDKTFAQRGGLATHALVHSGEKPYHCDECGKSFRQKYHLTQHQLIHSGLKPFQCEICQKSFNVKMNLREHMRRHTGERPYRCAYCACQGFFRKKMLRDHIVKSHPERPLPMDLQELGPTPKFPKARLASSKVHEELQNILDSPNLGAKFGSRRVPQLKVESDDSSGLVSVTTSASSMPQLDNIMAEDSQANSEGDDGGTQSAGGDVGEKKILPDSQVGAHFGPSEPILEESSGGKGQEGQLLAEGVSLGSI